MPPARYLSPLRVGPVQWETTTSYIQRLAARHHLTTAQLLSALNIPRPRAHDECSRSHGPYTAIELYLNAEARHRIGGFCGIREEHLTRALPAWSGYHDRGPAAAPRAQLRLSALYAVTGCPRCTLARTGSRRPLSQYLPDTHLVCHRHHTWILGRHTLNADPFPAEHACLIRAPEILTAHRAHIRLLRRWGQACDHALALAITLTEHWRRTAPADERIWPARTRRISPTRTRLWYALAREAITYPETIALAQLFTRHPRMLYTRARPGQPHPLHTTIAALLDRPWLNDPGYYPPRLLDHIPNTSSRRPLPHGRWPYRHASYHPGTVELTQLGYHPPHPHRPPTRLTT
jgi:hypothetical protein